MKKDEHIDDESLSLASKAIADEPAINIISETCVHFLSAAAVKIGLSGEEKDLDEARKLIDCLAALIITAKSHIGDMHLRPLLDGLKSVQLAFREASLIKDPPGKGPGEKFTGPVS